MTPIDIIAALCIPVNARVDQRVPKRLLVENSAPTAADKHQIKDGIEELIWIAALKPTTIGVPSFFDDTREYQEIAVLSLILRAGANSSRLTELIHRAIPYPVFLIQFQPMVPTLLSVAHIRWSHGQSGQTVLDRSIVKASVDTDIPTTKDFLTALSIASQSSQHLQAFYQSWIECFEAHAAARFTGIFRLSTNAASAELRHIALSEHERLSREIDSLRAIASKETQINRLVDLNLKLKELEARLVAVITHL